uniref:Uncharacterized protein n=1 Tax=Trichuris muris TaxID=70415 RepID=A0A5S6QKV0_TRIMR
MAAAMQWNMDGQGAKDRSAATFEKAGYYPERNSSSIKRPHRDWKSYEQQGYAVGCKGSRSKLKLFPFCPVERSLHWGDGGQGDNAPQNKLRRETPGEATASCVDGNVRAHSGAQLLNLSIPACGSVRPSNREPLESARCCRRERKSINFVNAEFRERRIPRPPVVRASLVGKHTPLKLVVRMPARATPTVGHQTDESTVRIRLYPGPVHRRSALSLVRSAALPCRGKR